MDPFSPITLSGLNLKNRWVLAPMTTYASQLDGVVNDDELPYYKSRAEAGYGLVLTAACYVHPSGHAFDGQWGCSDDRYLDSLKRVADAIHAGGAKAALQIHHGGRQCPSRLCGGTPWSASSIAAERPNAEVPRAMTGEEVEEIIAAFGQASRRAEEAGFDAVEIHGANTYLIQQFVSPHSNRRQDKWGEDRRMFSREIIRECRRCCSIPVGYRLSPEEPEHPGIRLADTFALIEDLLHEDIAWLDVSLRSYAQTSVHDAESKPVLEQIARILKGRLPLIAGGGVWSTVDAQACLSLGADLVYVGRAAISEPNFLNLAAIDEQVRREIPAESAAETLQLPTGLANKIYATPGWFPVATS
jgi:2,4-dienoyl-CoA reductase-like NADH-dependent reductase (Old Yellow Enzyme family)